MKLCSFLLLAAAPLLLQAQRSGFKINGKVQPEKITAHSVVFSYTGKDGNRVFDTCLVKKNKFKFAGVLAEPSRVSLKVIPDTTRRLQKKVYPLELIFCLDNSSVTMMVSSFKDYWIKGSPTRNDQLRYLAYYRTVADTLKGTALVRAERAAMETFVVNNPKSRMSLILLAELVRSRKQAGNTDSLFQLLDPSFKKLPSGQFIAEKIAAFQRVAVGLAAPAICLPDSSGRQICLSDLRGKFVLVEFWGSWCVPCRQENPNLVKAYAALQGKNFEILGIALEKSSRKEAWLKAIEKDGLSWLHISGLSEFDCPAAKTYCVTGVPRNFLINPEGIIIASDLRGEGLLEKLQAYIQ